MAGVLSEAGIAYYSRAHVLRFVCLCPAFYVLNVASVSGLSILDCPFGFLSRLFIYILYPLREQVYKQ